MAFVAIVNNDIAHLWCLRLAYLRTGEVVAGGKCGRVLVQCGLSIPHGIFRKVWEIEEAWLLRLSLLFKIAGIHCVRVSYVGYQLHV